MRSWLFVPGHRIELVPKAWASGAEAVIVDWEDAVSPQHKAQARAALPLAERAVWVRINSARHAEHAADLAALAAADNVAGVWLPKVESAAEIEAVAAACSLPVVAAVESVRGWTALPELAAAQGLRALSYGCLDLAKELSCRMGSSGADVLFDRLRSELVLQSARYGLHAPIESIYPDFHDAAGLQAYAQHARDMGFGAMLCIHPQQVAVVHGVWTLDADTLALAQAIVAETERSGETVFQIRGKMVDLPLIEWARQVSAEQSGTQ